MAERKKLFQSDCVLMEKKLLFVIVNIFFVKTLYTEADVLMTIPNWLVIFLSHQLILINLYIYDLCKNIF